MDPEALVDHYVKAVAELQHSTPEPHADSICQLIDAYHAKCSQKPYQILLEGEKAFWKNDFETALKKYLEAKSISNVQFFCFRASAFISEKMGHYDQAIEYARKALVHYPKDLTTTSLYTKLSETPKPTKELNQILKDYQPAPALFSEEEPNEEPPSPQPQLTNASSLSQKIEEALHQREKNLKDYKRHLEERPIPKEEFLTILNGWNGNRSPYPCCTASTGVFLRSMQYGIVINPGRHFLDHFHDAGYLIHDIDAVIVTQEADHCQEDLLALYHLNEELNELKSKRHVIQYYLHPSVMREHAQCLKSQYKEERHTLHSLELFANSENIETIPLHSDISIGYFSSSSSQNLGIIIECPRHKIGYISGCSWSPMLPVRLKGCDILCLGVGYSTQEDLTLQKHLHDCLGFYGIHSLLEHLEPKILLCSEFTSQMGDLRLEFVHELRQANTSLTILPADFGFYLDLQKQRLRCSISNKLLDIQHVKVTRNQGSFSKLHYLSEDSVL